MKEEFKTTDILGFPFVNTTFSSFMNQIKSRIEQRKNTFIITANPEIVVFAKKHPKYQNIIKSSNYITPDGVGIIKASHILNDDIPGRISGFDIFLNLLKWGNANHKSAYFLGAKPNVINDLKTTLNHNYPHLKISGIHDGYFNYDEQIVKDIQKTQPDMIFIALGYPKQDLFINKYRSISNGLWIGLGGSFDVLSGNTKRAPQFWINHHIEWFYRLLKEPSRLPRMMALPYFLYLIYQQKEKQRK
ncbi:acetylglucosaminyldiphosphoundecaprenol acetyl-beta-D-mannosaminyltransferase [Philodulcilactobacillus myokoensis]|uniref:N-acetylglucosaminyldiphosphoundecaprenol N-acetyl-beta-D-mannosaminyltransferase n=1 Tax=Philodulcilactobacillus myokoensis TaxID=2929573 RepID=A0A9W6B201_9LACO|nr:WecB/TagA/CpsF family glycosyltransferase [Philodulcilactobacillus myokoensis]GLB47193.1 acetylglucosaminyldiphosphoundecaprenol acetyl-beta-D-mannosaminyltransferase [Philodulcilactobacillus myokoensis]